MVNSHTAKHRCNYNHVNGVNKYMANNNTLKGTMKYGTLDYSYESKIKGSNGRGRTSIKRFGISDFDDVLASNSIFPLKNANWYNKCSRYGWIDPFDTDQIVKEFLFINL